jgi:hypothetical protein
MATFEGSIELVIKLLEFLLLKEAGQILTDLMKPASLNFLIEHIHSPYV